jgi:hypothetical protein
VMSLGSSSQFGTFVLSASTSFGAIFEQDAIVKYAMFQRKLLHLILFISYYIIEKNIFGPFYKKLRPIFKCIRCLISFVSLFIIRDNIKIEIKNE